MMGERNRLVIEIDKSGSLYFLLNAFLGAYNRRTDVIAKAAGLQEAADLDKLDKQINKADTELNKQP